MTCLTSVLKYAGSCAEVELRWRIGQGHQGSEALPHQARPDRQEHAADSPADRRREGALEAHFAAQNKHPRCKTDMVRVSKWQHSSSRRIGESCALLWTDWNPEKQTVLVRKMKDPRNRNKSKVVALPWDAQALLYEWAYEIDAKPELRNDEPRILPFNSKTCSQRYTLAKKRCRSSTCTCTTTGAIAARGSLKRTGTRLKKRSSTPGTTRRTCSSGPTWC
jgi:integrase